MFHARIVAKSGSLYVAAEGDAYDVQNLQQHARHLEAPREGKVRLEIAFDECFDSRRAAAIVATLRDTGMDVTVASPARVSAATA